MDKLDEKIKDAIARGYANHRQYSLSEVKRDYTTLIELIRQEVRKIFDEENLEQSEIKRLRERIKNAP